jgi:hypothetical protein
MKVQIIIPKTLYDRARESLFPADSSDEQFGFGIAGVTCFHGNCRLLVREFLPADRSCLLVQTGASIRPDPRFTMYVWILAKRSNSCLVEVHTHPFSDQHVTFSGVDDCSEQESFPKVVAYLGRGPHVSMVLGRNSLDARWFNVKTKTVEPVAAVRIVGSRLDTIVPTSVLPKQVHGHTDKGDEHGAI